MRMILTAALAAAIFEAGAQTPPTPPTPPAPPAVPAPAARPTPPAPPAPPDFSRDFDFDFNHDFNFDFKHDFDFRRDALRDALEFRRLDKDLLRDDALRALDFARIDKDAIREDALRVHIEEARHMAENALHKVTNDLAFAPRAIEQGMSMLDERRRAVERELSMLDQRVPRAIGADVAMLGERVGRGPTLTVVAPAPWLPQDPADSLYRVARDLLNRSQYRSAAETFRLISQRYPSSGYSPDVMYFEAYSLYRIGGQNELRAALQVLDRQKTRYPNAKIPDPGLLTRIQGELANGGDARAAQYVAAAASRQGQNCNRDDMAVRLEALNALSRMNIDSTTPILRRVLARRDECSISLRRQAITLMAKNYDAATTDILIDVLKNDPSPEVRRAAVSWLGEVPSERGAAALDEILRSPKDEDLQPSALRALASSRNPRAAQALRAVIERKDVSENLRREAMSTLARTDSAGTGAYLRALYPRLESRRMKEQALTQIARLRGEDNQKWMLAFVRDTTEPVELRRAALSTLTRSSATTVSEVAALFKSVPELELKQAIVSSLASRKEDEAVDALIAIYRASTDPKIHVQIINVLSRREDPRTQKLLIEILSK